jgi:hypothetical protein
LYQSKDGEAQSCHGSPCQGYPVPAIAGITLGECRHLESHLANRALDAEVLGKLPIDTIYLSLNPSESVHLNAVMFVHDFPFTLLMFALVTPFTLATLAMVTLLILAAIS